MNPTPRRKNPILRSRVPTLPPASRSRAALGMLRGAVLGRFELQHCAACGVPQYPPREACVQCLATAFEWRASDGRGELISETLLHHSQELFFRERGPWRVGLVRLDAGVSVVAHLAAACPAAPARVTLQTAIDRAGQAVLIAQPEGQAVPIADDPKLRDFSADPRGRKLLVTDAKSPVGQALVRELLAAGAALVWAGQCEPWRNPPGWHEVQALPGVTPVPFDATDTKSVATLAAEIGFKVDIVVHNAQMQRRGALLAQRGLETAQAEFELNALGLLRLAQAFAPVLRSRGADGPNGAVAWVNILSTTARVVDPAQAGFSASMAAAAAVSQALRAELAPGGVRVIEVFPGPLDDAWNQEVLPPKLAPAALAKAVADALRGSVEEVWPGEIAADLQQRLRADPKALEREMMR